MPRTLRHEGVSFEFYLSECFLSNLRYIKDWGGVLLFKKKKSEKCDVEGLMYISTSFALLEVYNLAHSFHSCPGSIAFDAVRQ